MEETKTDDYIQSLIKRDTPELVVKKKPKMNPKICKKEGYYSCEHCGEWNKFCPHTGHRIDWSE